MYETANFLKTTGSEALSLAAAVARGASRLLRERGFSVLSEVRVNRRRRADLVGLDRRGRVVIVEIKSSPADLRADRKWPEYLPYADWFYFAVPPHFPRNTLPADTGLIIADAHGGGIIRPAAPTAVNGNRRRTLTLLFARTAADRLGAADGVATPARVGRVT